MRKLWRYLGLQLARIGSVGFSLRGFCEESVEDIRASCKFNKGHGSPCPLFFVCGTPIIHGNKNRRLDGGATRLAAIL